VRKKTSLFFLLNVAIVALLLAGCGGGGGGDNWIPPVPAGGGKALVAGLVTGNTTAGGLADVTVTAVTNKAEVRQTVTTKTDANGAYFLKDAPINDNGKVVLEFTKSGYATLQKTISNVTDGQQYSLSPKMAVYAISEPNLDPTVQQTLTATDPNGDMSIGLTLPAGAVSGNDPITVSVAVGDPSTENGRALFPGDYEALDEQGADAQLESVAFSELKITQNDQEVKTLNQPATVQMRLPEEFQPWGEKSL
jgi:hypothetical protein